MTPEELAREPNLKALQHARSVRATDPLLALNQFRALAGLGSPMAMVDLAFMYSKGVGIKANVIEEEVWYKRAIEAGSVFAQFALAHLYFRTQRYPAAFVQCQSAVALGYAPAMYFLALMYREGAGTERNLDKERDLLYQATQRGHLWSRVRLGRVLMQGRWGLWQRLRGLLIFATGTICAIYVASRNPRDERLYGHDVLNPSADSTFQIDFRKRAAPRHRR
jgi:TPR repeat protein